MFSSFAALSSSRSIGEAKSTLTRWIGSIMRPVFVKKRETSFPASARRAMASAASGSFCLRMFFIKLLLLTCCSPQVHGVVMPAFLVFPPFKNQRVQSPSHPADGAVLFRKIGALVKV